MSHRRRRRSRRLVPGIRILSLILLFGSGGLFVLELLAFSQLEDRLPENVVVAGVNVGSMTPAEARVAWEQAYAQPIVLYYDNSPILLDPASIGFRLNLQKMVADAESVTQAEGSFWVRFFNHLTEQKIQGGTTIPLTADYQRSLLESFLQDIASRYDRPPGTPGFDLQTLTTFAGEDGFTLEIDSAVRLIDAALGSPVPEERVISLPIGGADANQPSMDTLRQLIVTFLDSQGFIYDGQSTTAGVFILDLQTGEEVNLLGDVAFSAASTQKFAILIDYFRQLSNPPTQDEAWLMANSLLCSDNGSSNLLMEIIGGGNIFNGIARVTETMQFTGAANSFLSAPFAEPGRELGSIAVPGTAPNPNFDTQPDPFNQTTAEDIGTLFALTYDCANFGSGLMTAYEASTFTQQECSQMLELMSANDLERLLQGGIAPDVRISHKNGWLNTSAVVGDAGIVYPPNGRNYVISVFLWKDSTEAEATRVGFEELWPLLEEISRATWNYFTPESALVAPRSLPPTARDCEQNGYLPPYGQVDLDNINGWRTPG